MAINKIERFFEETKEIKNLAITGETKTKKENLTKSASLNPKYIGVYLSNYYAKNTNKQFHLDLLK
ncbi:MAG: hypothetical protein WCG23_06040 [bacterium]